MDLLAETIAWFLDPANWQGPDGVPVRVGQHLLVSLVSVLAGAAIAVPIGLLVGHTRRAETLVVTIANLGRALPSLALLLILLPFVGIGDPLIVAALVLLTIPPVLVNTVVGIRQVEAELVEAGRGMGMGERQVLGRVELPVALPVILAGLRTAAVQVVATATLGALVAGGGLGRYIVDGLALRDEARLVAGAVLVAGLALGTERIFALLERRVLSPGLRARTLEPYREPS